MSADTSYECRWFFPGEVPPDIVDRFQTAGLWPSQGTLQTPSWPGQWREDRYIVVGASLGIKIRSEPDRAPGLELKGLLSDAGPVDFTGDTCGNTGHWAKWSHEGAKVPAGLLRAIGEDTETRCVRKQRLLRLIHLPSEAAPLEVPVDVFVERGVQLELTRLEVAGLTETQHWTLSFEAFPLDDGLADDVTSALAPFLGNLAASGLTLDNSLSYPQWLLTL